MKKFNAGKIIFDKLQHFEISQCSLLIFLLNINSQYCPFHYAPNFEKVGSILLSACPCVSVCFRPSVQKKFKARVLKFHIWIPRQKIAYPYFFSCLNYLPLPSYAPLKG